MYDIRLRYLMEDKASKGLRTMTQNVEKASKSSGLLSSAWGKVAAGAGAYFGARAGWKALVGFNANMEQARVQMAGMISLTTGQGWTQSMEQSVDLVGQLQERAKRSVGTTADMVAMASNIVRPIMQAGLSMKDLEDITAGSVVAARAFGIEAEVAARDIESVLMGRVRSVDRFARSLLEPMGVIGEEGRAAFNEMSEQQRAAALKAALTSEAITNMAKAQETSFSGVYSTFQDNLQIFLGKVGLPMFRALTSEIKSWNTWITANTDRVDEMARNLAGTLRDVFGLIRDVAAFFVNHADLLLTVAKGWAAWKIGGMAGGMLESVGGFAGRMTRRAGAGLLMAKMNETGLGVAKFGAGIANVTARLASFGPAIGLAGTALYGLYKWWHSAEEKRRAEERKRIEQGMALRGEVVLPELKKELGHFGARMDELAKLQEERAKWGVTPGAAGYTEKMAAWRAEEPAAYLREVELTEALTSKADDLRAMYKQIATYAKQENLLPGYRGAWTQQALAGAAARVATKKGLAGEDYAVAALESSFARLDYVLSQSQDPVADFARMLEGKFIPAVIESAQAAGLTAKGEGLPKLEGLKKPPKINVTIHRIEAKSEDPDRFVFDLVTTFQEAARTGSYRGGP